MIDKIIRDDDKNSIKKEFDSIKMPEESKKKVLNSLLDGVKDKEDMPQKVITVENKGKASVKGSRPFAALAAALLVCLVAVGAMYGIKGSVEVGDASENDTDSAQIEIDSIENSPKQLVGEEQGNLTVLGEGNGYKLIDYSNVLYDEGHEFSSFDFRNDKLYAIFNDTDNLSSDKRLSSENFYIKSFNTENGEVIDELNYTDIAKHLYGTKYDYDDNYTTISADFQDNGVSINVNYFTKDNQPLGYETLTYDNDFNLVGYWNYDDFDFDELYSEQVFSYDLKTLYIYKINYDSDLISVDLYACNPETIKTFKYEIKTKYNLNDFKYNYSAIFNIYPSSDGNVYYSMYIVDEYKSTAYFDLGDIIVDNGTVALNEITSFADEENTYSVEFLSYDDNGGVYFNNNGNLLKLQDGKMVEFGENIDTSLKGNIDFKVSPNGKFLAKIPECNSVYLMQGTTYDLESAISLGTNMHIEDTAPTGIKSIDIEGGKIYYGSIYGSFTSLCYFVQDLSS